MFIEQLSLNPLMYPVAEYASWMLPVVEFSIAILLFFPLLRKIGLFSALVLMVAFTGYVVYIINYNDELPCSCGGLLDFLSWPAHLVFNGVSILLLVLALRWLGNDRVLRLVRRSKIAKLKKSLQ